MNNKSAIKPLDYISLSLVISFLFFHNIFLVIFGIILSLYSINKNKIIKSINYFPEINSQNKKNSSQDVQDIKQIESRLEKSNIELVDLVEQTGFIPSNKR